MNDKVTLIDPEVAGTNCLVCGGSFTGKSTLLMTALNNLISQYPKRFDVIILFTESISSEPYINLPIKNVIVFNAFLPGLVYKIAQINQATSNRYGILIITDDVTTELRGKTGQKLFTIFRNSGISTISLCQDPKMLTPAARGSIHNIFVTGGKLGESRERLIEVFLKPYLKEKGYKTPEAMDRYLQMNCKIGSRSRKLIHIDNNKVEMSVLEIPKP